MDREISTKSRVTVEEERNNGGGISRRTFLKGAGSIAAAAAVLGLSGLKSKALAQPILPSITLPKEMMLKMYQRMQRIRQGEMKLWELAKERKYITSTGHPSLGEEATCVGVALAMEKGDLLTGSHRSHGYPLALGVELNPWMAEFFTKVTGTNKGHGGSMHIADAEHGCLAMTGLVGSGVPHALGVAKAFKIQGKKNVGVSTCGDGAMNSAGFGSSLNLAATWNVPVVFVINNNQMQIGRPAREDQSLLMVGKDLSVKASGFGIPGITVDGNDVFAVYKASKWCMDRARQLRGPSLLECVTYRHRSHGSALKPHEITQWPWNDSAELEYWLRRDPIKRFERATTEGLLTEAELASVREEVGAEVEEAVKFAVASPLPDPEEDFKYSREVFGA